MCGRGANSILLSGPTGYAACHSFDSHFRVSRVCLRRILYCTGRSYGRVIVSYRYDAGRILVKGQSCILYRSLQIVLAALLAS
eukprot:scaffold69010_cov56-Attheya_sp.AAC.2